MTTVNDLLLTSPDVNKERLETLKRLFPDLFSDEGLLNPEELRRIVTLAAAPTKERYECSWNGKAQAKRFAFEPSRSALLYDPTRSVNPERADGNIIIEGENLEVLKLLLSAYREQVKCIYIDPPYNIDGDHVYQDNYTQDQAEYWEETGVTESGVRMDTVSKASGRHHSKWMSLIYSRLLVARHLLKKDGVIFVSIDDNELPNLLKVMEDVFGEENFTAQLAWQSRESMQNDTDLSINHEYIVAFARNRRQENRRLKPSNAANWYAQEDFAFYPLPVDPARFSNPDNDQRGPWKLDPFDAPNVRTNLTYKIVNPTTGVEYWPPDGRCWRTEEPKYQDLLADGRIMFGIGGESAPKLKVFYEEVKDFGTVDNSSTLSLPRYTVEPEE